MIIDGERKEATSWSQKFPWVQREVRTCEMFKSGKKGDTTSVMITGWLLI